MSKESFDHQLARDCAHAFHISTGLGCTVSDVNGNIIYEEGPCITACPLAAFAGCSQKSCAEAHTYGMGEAERFGGKYIYFCPLGLTCFVSPIIGDSGTAAKITSGPFIMVEKNDFIDCELRENLHLDGDALRHCSASIDSIPFVPPSKATQLSNLLFMAVGFMNNVSAEKDMMETEQMYTLQGHINAYVSRLKENFTPSGYSLAKEQELLRCIAQGQRDQAHALLEEILSSLFLSRHSLPILKARGYELIVMISRVAAENGTDFEKALQMCQQYLQEGTAIEDFSRYCSWLSTTLNHFTDSMFGHSDSKHANIIHRCIQYIGVNYAENITLTNMASAVYMSPAYLSRVFRSETGVTFNQYLNRVRITKAKGLLKNRKLKLSDISQAVGYEDQSYFTRVFKKLTGCSPCQYRNKEL